MEQDWIWGLVGGLIIGTAAAVYLLVNGRIMGASGILGGLVDGSGRATWAERAAFIAGLVLMPVLFVPLYREVDTHLTPNLAVVVRPGSSWGSARGSPTAARAATASAASRGCRCAAWSPPSSTSSRAGSRSSCSATSWE
jgi:hypothetical protein